MAKSGVTGACTYSAGQRHAYYSHRAWAGPQCNRSVVQRKTEARECRDNQSLPVNIPRDHVSACLISRVDWRHNFRPSPRACTSASLTRLQSNRSDICRSFISVMHPAPLLSWRRIYAVHWAWVVCRSSSIIYVTADFYRIKPLSSYINRSISISK